MTLALSVSALAAAQEGTLTGGSITINDAVPGQTYKVYQILYLESYNKDANAYSYKANSEWAEWLATQTKYIKIDDQGYVTWVGAQTAERAQEFAKLAQKELANKTAAATATAPAAAEGETYSTVSFTGLNLGYYLLDSSMGSLCSLDTTNPDVTIEEKNQEPTNVKQVEEDSTGTLGSVNDADIGQMVKFVSEITIPVGSEKVIFHDKMSEGLTLVSGEEGKTGVTVYRDAALTDILPDDNWHQYAPGKEEDCTFEVDFANYLDLVTKDTTLYIVYYATVNENAVVGDKGNPNESWLSYGENNDITTVPSKTTTYTWKVDVLKYTMVKGEDGTETKTNLAGAVFTLSKNSDGTNPIALIKVKDNVYRVAKTGETGTITEITTDATGAFTIEGLDSDTYYLTEEVAPAGYNTLKEAVKIVIANDGKVTYNGTVVDTVEVLNQTGTELPSTGGIGTTIFYVLGGALMVGAFVLLVVRKRMRAE